MGPHTKGESYDHDPAAAKFFDSFAEAFDTLYDGKRNFLMRSVDRRFRSDMFIRFALTFEVLGDLARKDRARYWLWLRALHCGGAQTWCQSGNGD